MQGRSYAAKWRPGFGRRALYEYWSRRLTLGSSGSASGMEYGSFARSNLL